MLLPAARQVCPAFPGHTLLPHGTATGQTWQSQLLDAKESSCKALPWWGTFLTALGAGYSPVTSRHFKKHLSWLGCNKLSMVGCVSLHLSASVLASSGHCQVGRLGFPNPWAPLAAGEVANRV